MAVTYQAQSGRVDVELAVAPETSLNTYVTPSVQIPHAGVRWTRGHSMIEGRAATSTTQHSISHRAIRGTDTPRVSFVCPFSDNSIATIFRMIFGGTLGGGTWAISDTLEGWSFGIVAGGSEYWKFAGGRMESAQLAVPVGAQGEVSSSWIFHSLVDPKTAPTTFPTIVPVTDIAPWVLKDVEFKESASTTFSGSAIPIQGVNLNITRAAKAVHGSRSTEPQSIIRGSIDITGSIDFAWSPDLQADFESFVAAEASAGYTLRYYQLRFTNGVEEQKLVLPVKYDWDEFVAPASDDPVTTSIKFVAAGVGSTPTTPVATVTDV